MNQKLEAAYQLRHACKDFDTNKKISTTDWNTIIQAAHQSPSSFGMEPWKFLVIENLEIREKLKENAWGAQNQLPHSSHFVIILARKGKHLRPDSKYVQKIMTDIKQFPKDILKLYTQFYTQFQEQDFCLETDEDRFDWAKRQTYIPLANMMHSAALLGIDSCPIEGFHETNTNKTLAEVCGVNLDEYGVSVMVSFGYRAAEPKHAKVRRPFQSVVEVI